MWKEKNVFVTGANGFVGSWITKCLVEAGATVTVLIRDNVPNSNLNVLRLSDKINIVNGSLVDYTVLERAINEYEVEYVFHLGAQTLVGTANQSPLSTFESNIKGTWNILEVCRNNSRVKGVVVASSDKAYGRHENLPYTEEYTLNGLHPYDASKTCTDILSRTYFNTYGMPVAVTRCANIYGGGDLNFSRIIPGTIKSVFFGEIPVIRSDGTPTRDYMYIEDAVSAYLTLAENIERFKGCAFNFGTETPISVLDLIKKIISLMGKDIEPKVMGTARGEIDDQYLSAKKAREVLGWQPRFDLDAGLGRTIAWYLDFFKNIYKK